ncbi:MAG: DUF2892 domain-containing protein [Candidatus Sumerlaeia bacterium]|nr:DUF2892 domain-containing protein [Candidatus Sumerlaeia bacterium]
MAAIKETTPQTVWQEIKDGKSVRLIDVRTPMEYQQVHAEKAELLPLQFLDKAACGKLQKESEGASVYLICKSGSRAAKAAAILAEHQIEITGVVAGGTDAWITGGLPVLRSGKGISLERQVRIAIGVPVVLFSLLALLVNPYFALVPLFFGCGLTFAGITDWCGLALLLARMPWNRTAPDTGASCTIR